MKRTDIKTLIEAMRIISEGIQSEGGVANAAIAEAGQRLQEQNDYIKLLEDAAVGYVPPNLWAKIKESKP